MGGKLKALESILMSRVRSFNRVGLTYDGNRDLYKTLGYKRRLHFEDYWQRYFRGGVAARVVDAFPNATWRTRPRIISENPQFNEAWTSLVNRLKVFHYMERADRISGIGHYGALLIGARNTGSTENPLPKVRNEDDIIFLAPYSEGHAEIYSFIQDTGNPRFGFPETYTIQPVAETEDTRLTLPSFEAHHSRVLHIAEGLVEDEILGVPRQKRVWNYLDDLDKIVGGSAEAVWRTVDRGIQFDLDKDAELDPSDAGNMEDEMDEFVHGFKRYLKTQGVTANPLGSDVPDPRGAFEIVVALISGTTGIPQRVLTGSERGQLASNQDERNFNARVKERQVSYAEPLILRPFIDKLMEIGALPEADYTVEWPDLSTMTRREHADVAARVAQAVSNAAKGTDVMSGDEFKNRFLDFSVPAPAEGPEDSLDDTGTNEASSSDSSRD